MAYTDAILVTGATGHVGQHVVQGLRRRGLPVRALARRPDPAGADGVRSVSADLLMPDGVHPGLEEALDGVDAVFLLWWSFSARGAASVVSAIGSRVRHVVYLSAMSVRDDGDPATNGVWGELEQLVAASGAEWTFLRCGGFATNTLLWADQIRAEGTVRWPYRRAGRSLIHERDIADVAVRALTEPGHAGRAYVLTGPEVVTQAEQVALIGEAISRPVRWEELPVEQARRQMLETGGDPRFVDGSLAYWTSLVDRPEPVTHAVQDLTGSPARTFREWAADHAGDFAQQTSLAR
jgi:uncharacterized protein YbjT (DUF2867 family)